MGRLGRQIRAELQRKKDLSRPLCRCPSPYANSRDATPETNAAAVRALARISHHLTVEARNKPAITALRLLAVLNVLFKYASARRAARALY